MIKTRIFLFLTLLCAVSFCQELDLRLAADRCMTSGENTSAFIRKSNGTQLLELRTAFTSGNTRRASWDIPIQMDLSRSAGLNLRLCCRNPEIVSQFNVYVKSDNGWQAAQFEIESNEQWASIFIPKTNFTPDSGSTSGWARCHTLRIAAWKGAAGQLQLFFTKIEFRRQNASVAIVRGGGNGDDKKFREAARYARNINNALSAQGLHPAVIDENDMAFTILRPYKSVIVPACDAFSSSGRDNIIQYLHSGGHCGFFHSLPATIAAVIGTPVGKFKSASEVPGAIGGLTLDPSAFAPVSVVNQASTAFIAAENFPPTNKALAWWHTSTGQKTKWPAILESKNAFWMTHVYLNQDQNNGGIMLLKLISRQEPTALKAAATTIINDTAVSIALSRSPARQKATDSLNQAKTCLNSGKLQDIAPLCRKALASLVGNVTNSKAINPNEMRAAWCTTPNGLPGKNWKQTLDILSANGFNAIFPLTASPYSASFKSNVVSQHPGEGLKECIAAAGACGVNVHAWINCLGIDDAPDATIRYFAKAGRLQEDAQGKQLPWLCPNNTENRRLLSRLVTEIVSTHKVTGVHFDRIRYPGSNSCYCKNCRDAFAKHIGFTPKHWPDIVLGGEYQAKWREFRIASINAVLYEMTSAALAANSRTLISAAVYPDCRQSPASVGQDWAKWCQNKNVSFVCPMNYHGSTAQFTGDIKRQIECTRHPEMLVPGIGTATNRLEPDELASQISATRSFKTYGFIIFSLGQREALSLMPAIRKMGVTR